MSKGSPIIQVRIPQRDLDAMDLTITRRNDNTDREPWTRSSFVVDAIREKVLKMARGRGKRGHQKAEDATVYE